MRMVRESHASHLDVVFNRNADFRADLQLALALAILGARACKNGFVVFGWAQGGLISHGPEFSRRCIAQINKSSPAIARGILSPAGDRQIAPTAVAASGVGDCQVVTAVGQELDLRRARSGGVEGSHLSTLTHSASSIHLIPGVAKASEKRPSRSHRQFLGGLKRSSAAGGAGANLWFGK